jgi:hypothetical protein
VIFKVGRSIKGTSMTVHKLTSACDLLPVVLLVEDGGLVRWEIANYLRSRGWLV